MTGMRYQPQGRTKLGGSPGLARGLVSYIPLTGKSYSDVVDGSAWNVVASSSPVAYDGAPRGLGMRVKGTTAAYVTRPIPAAISASATQPLTMRFRVYFHSVSSTHAIMSWGSVAQDGTPRFYIHLAGSVLEFFFSGTYHYAPAVVVEREYIVTQTFDGATFCAYLDGALIGSTGGGAAWAGNFASLYLGTGFNGQTASSDFLLSDFAMWNRTLSPQEVASDSQSPWQMFSAPEEDFEPAVITSGIFATNGSSTAAANATAISQAIVGVYGTSSAAASASAAALSILQTSASSAGLASAGGSACSIIQVSATSAGTGSGSATANSVWRASGASNGVASASGVTVAVASTAASSTGTASAGASAISIATTGGLSVGSATAAANGISIWQVAGASYGTSSVAGSSTTQQGTNTVAVLGAASGQSTASGTTQTIAGVIAAAVGSATANASAITIAATTASAAGTGSASATAGTVKPSTGSATGMSLLSADAKSVVGAVGSAQGTSSSQAIVVMIVQAAGFSVGSAAVSAISSAVAGVIGSSSGSATVRGVTEGGVHYTAIGDKLSMTLILSPYAISLDDNSFNITLN